MEYSKENDYVRGRGAQFNTENRYQRLQYAQDDVDGMDNPPSSTEVDARTRFLYESPKKIISLNKVEEDFKRELLDRYRKQKSKE